MKYIVTYCAEDSNEGGANPFWHGLLLLSTQNKDHEPIVVQDAVGFYSQPSTTKNPIIKGLKNLLGFAIDLQDGHGVLKKESMREIDGNGLHGVSFEVNESQYASLMALYQEKMKLEQEAIDELNAELEAREEEQNNYNRYVLEKQKAELENRDPRLSPFHITMDLGWGGFDSTASHACKNMALNLLETVGIINEETRKHIEGGKFSHAFPRYSNGLLKPLRLVSTGQPIPERSKTKDNILYYNRKWKSNNLYWATHPHFYQTELQNKDETAKAKKEHRAIKKILTRIHGMEVTLLKKIHELETDYDQDTQMIEALKKQLHRIQLLYHDFKTSTQNHQPHSLKAKLLHAETTLNVATMSLSPEKMDYSFLFRAYASASMRHALLGIICLVAAGLFLSTIPAAIAMSLTGTYSSYRCYGFFKSELKHAVECADYAAFQQYQHKPSHEFSEETAGNYSPV